MEFEEYLIKKKIDRQTFEKAEPERFAEWRYLFGQISEQSFTIQKLYLINAIRRKYQLILDNKIDKPVPPISKVRPIIKPRPKIN